MEDYFRYSILFLMQMELGYFLYEYKKMLVDINGRALSISMTYDSAGI